MHCFRVSDSGGHACIAPNRRLQVCGNREKPALMRIGLRLPLRSQHCAEALGLPTWNDRVRALCGRLAGLGGEALQAKSLPLLSDLRAARAARASRRRFLTAVRLCGT